MSEWSEWSDCSNDSDSYKFRVRECLNRDLGECIGETIQYEICSVYTNNTKSNQVMDVNLNGKKISKKYIELNLKYS